MDGKTYETDDVVDDFVVGVSSVATLMSNNPDTREDQSLEPPAKSRH